jgi:hypothetical protein
MSKFIPYPKRFKDIDKKSYDYNKRIADLKEKSKTDEKAKQEYERELVLQELDGSVNKNQSDGFNSGGYDWCCKNWKTKWNFVDVHIENNKNGELKYSFQTAWSVPMPILIKMSKNFPKLVFDYFGDEESEAFTYEATFKRGKIAEEEFKNWEDIQIEKIYDGDIDCFDKAIQEELLKHKGHKINYNSKEKKFKCDVCDKIIWSLV